MNSIAEPIVSDRTEGMDVVLKRKLHQEYLERLHPMPKNIWRPELTEEQKKELEEKINAGLIPF